MSSEISPSAQAVRASEARYQQSHADLAKQSAKQSEESKSEAATTQSRPTDSHLGRSVDVKI